jgi:hypothetical protein
VTRSINGSSFCSRRFTDFTALLTNTAIATIAIAMMMNDREITTITQKSGSFRFICSARRDMRYYDWRLPIVGVVMPVAIAAVDQSFCALREESNQQPAIARRQLP